jgi:hypothetical protein
MEGEAIAMIVPNFEYIEKRRSWNIAGYFKQPPDFFVPFSAWIDSFWPNGWFDQNKAQAISAMLSNAQTVDSKLRRVFPKQADDLENRAKLLQHRWDGYAPWNFLFSVSVQPLLAATPHFAQAEVLVDEPRIACALERYRLAYGVYPGSLNALVPVYAGDLPHDIMTGQPYHYRLRPDGTFLLYSIGWNQKDDEGKQDDCIWPPR